MTTFDFFVCVNIDASPANVMNYIIFKQVVMGMNHGPNATITEIMNIVISEYVVMAYFIGVPNATSLKSVI